MLRFREIPLAKKFMDQRQGGEYQAFPSKTLSQSAKKIVGLPFCATFQKNSASEKVFG